MQVQFSEVGIPKGSGSHITENFMEETIEYFSERKTDAFLSGFFENLRRTASDLFKL